MRARRRCGTAVLAAALLAVAGCGDDDGPPVADDPETGAGCVVADGGRVTVVADDLAWDTDCLELPADQPVTIVVDNRDRGVNHNLHVIDAPGGPATELETGPDVQELPGQLPAGTYRYVCDIHPTMVGELRVTGQPGPPAGS